MSGARSTVSIGVDDDMAAIVQAIKAELRDPMEPLSLLVRFQVAEADRGKVEAAFRRARSTTLAEPGCVVFALNRDARDPDRYVVYEQWRSFADLETHLRTDNVARLRAVLGEVIVGPPELQTLLPAA